MSEDAKNQLLHYTSVTRWTVMCNWLKYHHEKLSDVEFIEFLKEMDQHFHSVRNYLESIREAKVAVETRIQEKIHEIFGDESEDEEASASSIAVATPFFF